jgi:hypothetical protein
MKNLNMGVGAGGAKDPQKTQAPATKPTQPSKPKK